MIYDVDQLEDPAHTYVFLNDRPLDRCLRCDDAAGWAEVLITDRWGLPIPDEAQTFDGLTVRVFGRVRVVQSPTPPVEWTTRPRFAPRYDCY